MSSTDPFWIIYKQMKFWSWIDLNDLTPDPNSFTEHKPPWESYLWRMVWLISYQNVNAMIYYSLHSQNSIAGEIEITSSIWSCQGNKSQVLSHTPDNWSSIWSCQGNKSQVLSHTPRASCCHCGTILTMDHMLLEWNLALGVLKLNNCE